MNKIIAPVDFSDVSLNAVKYAAYMAAELNKTLLLVHIVQIPVVYGEVPVPIGDFDAQQAEAEEELDKLALSLEQEFRGQLTVHKSIKLGSPVFELLELSKSNRAYAMVLGTHGAGAVERFLLGSVTLSMVKDGHCPVVVVPSGFTYRKPKMIALACDFKNVVKSLPDKDIASFVEDFDAKLQILHADPNYTEFEPAFMEEGLMLDTMFQTLKPSYQFLHTGYTEESILNYAAHNNVDLLMILPKHHGFVESLFRHQHTSTFILNATVPIVVFRCMG